MFSSSRGVESLEERFEQFCKSQERAHESLRAELDSQRKAANELIAAKVQDQQREIAQLKAELNILGPKEDEFLDTIPKRQVIEESEDSDDLERGGAKSIVHCCGLFSFLRQVGNTISTGRIMFGHNDNIRFHMHSVAAVVQNNPSKRIQQWLFASASVILVLMQLQVLFWLVYDASHPVCATHIDCRVGEYCHAGFNGNSPFDVPRCTDCDSAGFMNYSDKSSRVSEEVCSPFDGQNDDLDLTEIDQSTVWMSGLQKYYPKSLNSTHLACIEHQYCKTTELNLDDFSAENKPRCDHLHLNMIRFGIAQRLVFAFVACLFAAILYKDIEECTMEEAVLEDGIENREVVSMPTQIIRLALRLRRVILPWWVAAGTVSIMISEDLSMKNILLNFLAIGFITEADNLIGILLMTQAQKDSTRKFMDDVKMNKTIEVSTTWSKVFGITPAVMMYFAVIFMETFAKLSHEGGNCADIEDALSGVFFNISPAVFVALHGIAKCFSKKEKTIYKRTLRVMKNCTQSINALSLSWVWYYLLFLWVSKKWRAKYTIVLVAFVVNCFLTLLLWNYQKRKTFVMYFTITYWLWLSGMLVWFYLLHTTQQ